MGNALDTGFRENKHQHFMINNGFSENRAIYETMPKNIFELEWPQMAIKYGACALHAG
jgi:hypothetical protein